MTTQELDEQIRSFTRGEAANFAQFYEQQQARIRSVVFRMCGGADLEDLVQESFVRTWTSLSQFKGQSKLSTWVYRIAVNTALDHLRKEKRVRAQSQDLVLEKRASKNQEENFIEEESVTRALASLDEKHRSVFVLHVFEEQSLDEIANILSLPEGTVKSRLFHARKDLTAFIGNQEKRYGS